MDATLHVASLSGQTLLRVQRGHLGEHATVAQLETLLRMNPTSSDEKDEEEVTFMSAGEILEDESLLVDLPCQAFKQFDDPTGFHMQRVGLIWYRQQQDEHQIIEIQRVVQKSLKFCLQLRRGFHLVGVRQTNHPGDRQIEKYISRKVAAKMTVGDLKALLFLQHERPMSQVSHDLTSGGAALVDTDKLKEVWSLKDVEEVHLGLTAKRTMHYYVLIPGMAPHAGAGAVQPLPPLPQAAAMLQQPPPQLAPHARAAAVQPLPPAVVPLPQAAAMFQQPLPQLAPHAGAAAVQPMPPALAQLPQAAAMFQQLLPQLMAQHPPHLAAVQPCAQVVPQHLPGPALPPHLQDAPQHVELNAEAPSHAELQTLMQQRLESSLRQNRAAYFQ